MTNIKILFLSILFFPLTISAQARNAQTLTMLMNLGNIKAPKAVRVISYPEVLIGHLVYENNRIDADFIIKNNYIKHDNDSIFLSDEKLSYMELNAGSKRFVFERVEKKKRLQRVLIDTLGFKVYDKVSFNDKVYKEAIFFKYKEEYHFVERAMLRGLPASIRKTLEAIKLDDDFVKGLALAKLDL